MVPGGTCARAQARPLAWKSQRFAATRARWRAMTALRLIRVLDVLHEHASALEPARALSVRASPHPRVEA